MHKISVILPVYNVEDYLKRCLDSILNQTFQDFNVIAVDDGSSDNSLAILNEYAKSDSRLKVISQSHHGVGFARNEGLKHTDGEYILFVDADDWICDNALEILYANAASNDSDIVLLNSREIHTDKIKKRIYFDEDIKNTFSYTIDRRLVLNRMLVVWSKFYRTSFLKNNNITFPDYPFFEDVPFHVEVMLKSSKITYVNEILYNYNRLNVKSLQNSNPDRTPLFDIFADIEKILIENDCMDEFENEFLDFRLRQLKDNLELSDDAHFYNMVRSYLLSCEISPQALPINLYGFYIAVLNFKSYEKFQIFADNIGKRRNYIKKHEISQKISEFDDSGVMEPVIVSLTSVPERIHDIHYCLYSLLTQSLKPYKVILWLSKSEFPNMEDDIPDEVLKLKRNGLSIEWCEDIGPYKKLIPALRKFPDSYIVTADDDIYYPQDWLENIWAQHLKYPDAIISSRSRRINLNKNYADWPLSTGSEKPSYLNFPTNGAGTLFLPNSLSLKVFDEDLFLKLAPTADDMWFWTMMILNRRKISTVEKPLHVLTYVNMARELSILNQQTLWGTNQHANDRYFKTILNEFPEILEIINEFSQRQD